MYKNHHGYKSVWTKIDIYLIIFKKNKCVINMDFEKKNMHSASVCDLVFLCDLMDIAHGVKKKDIQPRFFPPIGLTYVLIAMG